MFLYSFLFFQMVFRWVLLGFRGLSVRFNDSKGVLIRGLRVVLIVVFNRTSTLLGDDYPRRYCRLDAQSQVPFFRQRLFSVSFLDDLLTNAR